MDPVTPMAEPTRVVNVASTYSFRSCLTKSQRRIRIAPTATFATVTEDWGE